MRVGQDHAAQTDGVGRAVGHEGLACVGQPLLEVRQAGGDPPPCSG